MARPIHLLKKCCDTQSECFIERCIRNAILNAGRLSDGLVLFYVCYSLSKHKFSFAHTYDIYADVWL